jgi:hypothetical protein
MLSHLQGEETSQLFEHMVGDDELVCFIDIVCILYNVKIHADVVFM